MTGSKVKMKLCRYLKSLNFEQQHVKEQIQNWKSDFDMFSLLQDDGVYRLTAVPDRVVLTQDTAAHCNMSLSSNNMSPVTPAKVRFIDWCKYFNGCNKIFQNDFIGLELRENYQLKDEEMQEITFNKESILVKIIHFHKGGLR